MGWRHCLGSTKVWTMVMKCKQRENMRWIVRADWLDLLLLGRGTSRIFVLMLEFQSTPLGLIGRTQTVEGSTQTISECNGFGLVSGLCNFQKLNCLCGSSLLAWLCCCGWCLEVHSFGRWGHLKDRGDAVLWVLEVQNFPGVEALELLFTLASAIWYNRNNATFRDQKRSASKGKVAMWDGSAGVVRNYGGRGWGGRWWDLVWSKFSVPLMQRPYWGFGSFMGDWIC